MNKKVEYTKEMYEYLTWRMFRRVYGATEWVKEESERINGFITTARTKLANDQIKIVNNRELQLGNDYERWMLENFRGNYDSNFAEEDNYEFDHPIIEYNRDFYRTWKSAVAKRRTVELKYDSATSGMSERLVDPYGSSAPYGEGYCHKRKEVRQFRFDRVIDINITDNKFDKPKDWKNANRDADYITYGM